MTKHYRMEAKAGAFKMGMGEVREGESDDKVDIMELYNQLPRPQQILIDDVVLSMYRHYMFMGDNARREAHDG